MIESKLTDYDGMNDTSNTGGNWAMRPPHEVSNHLLIDPEKNAVLLRLESRTGEGAVVAVWGGKDQADDFWWIQRLPLEDPGDATPFDGTAAEAIIEAIRDLT